MRRLDPNTSLPFKRGAKREDGATFRRYRFDRPLTADGYYQEHWISAEAVEVARVSENKRRMNRKHAWYQALCRYKELRGCADCGYNEDGRALQFDHLTEDKSFDVARGHTRSNTQIINEVRKCDVVCANCHAIRTSRRRADRNITDPVYVAQKAIELLTLLTEQVPALDTLVEP